MKLVGMYFYGKSGMYGSGEMYIGRVEAELKDDTIALEAILDDGARVILEGPGLGSYRFFETQEARKKDIEAVKQKIKKREDAQRASGMPSGFMNPGLITSNELAEL